MVVCETGGSGVVWLQKGHPRLWRQLGERVKRVDCMDYLGGLECDKWANVVAVESGEHDISPVGWV